MLRPEITLYSLTACIGLALSYWMWKRRLSGRSPQESRALVMIYSMGLIFALLGAKAMYFFAEGGTVLGDAQLTAEEKMRALLAGKTVTGALLGGYVGVEVAKKWLGYRAATGDLFAAIVPLGLLLGRVGCLFVGCCQGIEIEPAWYAMRGADGVNRWPSVPLELGFNAAALIAFAVFTAKGWFRGQHFHLYLIAYGVFRFLHEFMRATPRVAMGLSGYHVAALLLVALGAVRYAQRRREMKSAVVQ